MPGACRAANPQRDERAAESRSCAAHCFAAAEQTRLLQSLQGTSLNLKTFIPLYVKYGVSGEFPSYYSHGYLHDKMIGRDDWSKLDAENRRNLEQYVRTSM